MKHSLLIIIIIIISCWQHGYPWPSFATPPYRFIALGRSSGQQPVSSHSCWMYVRAGRPAFARPCVGIHKSTSLMSSSLLLQQCPACLVRLTWIVFVIGGRWPYSWCLVGCCRQDFVALAAWISLTLSRHPSLSSIASGRSSRLYPITVQNCFQSAGDKEYSYCISAEG